MEETASDIKKFLNEFGNSTSEFNINPKIIGNYVLNRQDVSMQVIDWVLNYLEDRSCPYNIAVSIAKETAQQIENSISEQQLKDSPDGKLLNSLTLYNDAIKKVALICKSYQEEVNEMELQAFSLPYSASVFAVKNKRRKMEDRHVIHHDLNLLLDLKNCPHHSYYAVFDGHSGVDAASYASAHLHVNIANHPAFLTDTSAAITEAYKMTDQNFIKKCYEENLKSGTTAVCALIREKTVFLSWVGDSQAVLVKEGKPAIVTSAHKPDREDERKRVEDLGGTIQFIGTYRVNGMLAVTRAIGDADHKPFISSEPEITVVDLDGSEDFLILACDGLWDGMSPEDVVAALYYNLLENGQDDPFDTMAAKLVHQSKLQGSEDNITAVVIFLRDIKVIKEEAQKYIPTLSKSNFKVNFFETNGGDKQLMDMVTSTPISKPNVLEFNNSSIKKLKNTANVLSAAGLGDSFTDYVESYHASNFAKLNQQVAAPETTALSELPTPPIDDVIASQQFEQICSTNLAQKFEEVSANKLSDGGDGSSPLTDINLDDNFVKDLKQPQTEEATSKNDKINLSSEELSPEEAVDIASTVVSEAIETAVKCISEKESNPAEARVSPQKLNPYAEPFVMKSYMQSESNLINISPSATELSSVEKNKSEIQELVDLENSSPDAVKNDIETDISCSPRLEVKEHISLASFDLPPTANQQVPISSVRQSEDMLLLGDMQQISLVDNSVFDDIGTPKKATQSVTEGIAIESSLKPIMDNLIKPKDVPVQNLNEVINAEQKQIDENIINITLPDSVIDISDEKMSPLKEFLSKEDDNSHPNENILYQNQNEVIHDSEIIVTQTTQNIELIDISADSPNTDITGLKSGSMESGGFVENSSVNVHSITEKSLVTEFSRISMHEEQVCEIQSPCKDENETGVLCPGDHIPEAAIILGGVSLPLVDDKTAAVLPSDHSEESHTEAVAVDLQSIPVGVPEAEGVTEDIDSDSEKDGGWSYMKGNVDGVKNKSASEKTAKKDVSGIKKDAQKSTDVKSKLKSTVISEKNKKPLTEKKSSEVKGKMSKPLPTNASKTTIDKPKVASTSTLAAKRPISAAKTTTVPSTKMSRPATVARSAPTQSKPRAAAQNKPGATIQNKPRASAQNKPEGTVQNKHGVVPSMSRIQTATKTTSSNTTSARLKPNNGVSATLAASNSIAKKQPGNTQTTKSSTMSSVRNAMNRPAVTAVPSRALSATKPTTLQKTSLVGKPKQTLSTLKKPEVKETKELSNKQLSEKKSPLPKIASRGTVSNANSNTLKSSASGISKTTAKPRNVPAKSDLNKDVPKTQISRLATRNASQIKSTKDSSKATVKNSSSFQKNTMQIANQLVKEDEGKTEEATPSEEEKLLREVNDVEIPTKELADSAAAVDDQEKPPVENGHVPQLEEKILNDQPVSNPTETLL